jgi:hypothetical protein
MMNPTMSSAIPADPAGQGERGSAGLGAEIDRSVAGAGTRAQVPMVPRPRAGRAKRGRSFSCRLPAIVDR